METKNLEVSLEEARNWFNSNDNFKRSLALKLFSLEDLIGKSWESFSNPINVLEYDKKYLFLKTKNIEVTDLEEAILTLFAVVNCINKVSKNLYTEQNDFWYSPYAYVSKTKLQDVKRYGDYYCQFKIKPCCFKSNLHKSGFDTEFNYDKLFAVRTTEQARFIIKHYGYILFNLAIYLRERSENRDLSFT